MRCVMVMFDSLNRHLLPPYSADTWVKAPNFQRLAKRTATFEKSYVCSMPCMPARRDLHTGRPSFLHCPWGPLEPFDDSVPAMLSKAGVYTHLSSDHYHYWEDGGATYHNRYSSWDSHRGQEGDQWIGQVAEPVIPENLNGKGRRQDWVNRPYMSQDENHPQTKTFKAGLEFISRNHAQDKWFLQIECFDPHEPFFCEKSYRDEYPNDPVGMPLFDWPPYGKVTQAPDQVEAARRNYAALVTKCDESLGKVLDAFDQYNLWDDTMLIVCTDHGFMLGEHGWWAKNVPPLYQEVSHTPFFMHDPRHPTPGERRGALVQPAIDIGPTLLGFFGLSPTERMLGKDLSPVIQSDQKVRDYALFGYHGSRVNITDGRYVYLREPVTKNNGPLFSYTLMPTAMRGFKKGLSDVTLVDGGTLSSGDPVLRIPNQSEAVGLRATDESLLFDLETDPAENHPLEDAKIRDRMAAAMVEMMKTCDAPAEQFVRMGLTAS